MSSKTIKFGYSDDHEIAAGDVIREWDGFLHLVGTINENGGVCDDCAGIRFGEDVELLGNVFDDASLLALFADRSTDAVRT